MTRQGSVPDSEEAKPAALGLRAHSGWAALVVVAGAARAPAVVDRRRIVIADPAMREARQPYHAAERLPLPEARELLRRCTARTQLLARQALRRVVRELRAQGYNVVSCGLLLASGRPLPGLAATLASHALIHTAEGEFFRNALVRASEGCGIPVTGVREKELFARAQAVLRISADALRTRIAELGRALGPPWSQDEKYAALVGWLALTAAPR